MTFSFFLPQNGKRRLADVPGVAKDEFGQMNSKDEFRSLPSETSDGKVCTFARSALCQLRESLALFAVLIFRGKRTDPKGATCPVSPHTP
jgi:hypothetical protein